MERPGPRALSVKSDNSKDWLTDFKRLSTDLRDQDSDVPSGQEPQLDKIFKCLEENIVKFVRDQLKRFYTALISDNTEDLESEEGGEESNREAFLNITLNFLKRMNQGELAQCLQNKAVYQSKLKSHLKQRFSCVFEGITKAGHPTLLNQIYTELYITEGGDIGLNQEHEVMHIQTFSRRPAATEAAIRCEDIFKGPPHWHGPIRTELMQGPIRTELTQGPIRTERTQGPIRTELTQGPIRTELTQGPIRTELTHGPIRTELTQGPIRTELTQGPIRVVLTKGVAGVGKTVLTQKFSLDWAEGRTNQDIQLLFPFTFRELNGLKDRQFSLVGLLQHFFSESKGLCSFQHLQVVFIFDGLDECRLPLDFNQTRVLTEATDSGSVDVLLVNLIRGNLLPSARLWITTRPAAANQIPPECVSMVTEVQGFTHQQKEEYFRKRFANKEQATAVISHIKTSHTLYIMCHIPVFCWIISTVLLHVMKTTDRLPKNLTELYIHFLVVLAKVKNMKYDGRSETDTHWTPETRKMVECLGKLAFEQLQKGNLIFYESDLMECGLEPTEASVYSGVFTQVFREEPGLYQDKVYCFIHLIIQEFLAALHVHQTFKSGVNLLSTQQPSESPQYYHYYNSPETVFYRSAVDQAIQSTNGHLDLFLRFLLGLSLPTNQSLLHGLLPQTGSEQTNQETVRYIKWKLDYSRLSAERSMNLFHCLNELNDCSLVKKIQRHMREGHLSVGYMSPANLSALAFLLLSSDTDLEEFDLSKYHPSEKTLRGLLPVVKACRKAILSCCDLSQNICGPLSSVLSSSSLTLLDLSNNNLQDPGVELLCAGLNSAPCRLETLSLSCCDLSQKICGPLSSVLSSSSLTLLDLSNNNLQDSGVELLCAGLNSAPCRLETLRLSGCLVSEEGGASLASALGSAHSHLRELDLRYNHPGPSAELLIALKEDPHCREGYERLEPAGKRWMIPGLRKYSCEHSFDHTTFKQHRGSFRMMNGPDSFSPDRHVLSSTGLTGRCYWEVNWGLNWDEDSINDTFTESIINIAVCYRGMCHEENTDCEFGDNDQSWSLRIYKREFRVCHNSRETSFYSFTVIDPSVDTVHPSAYHFSGGVPSGRMSMSSGRVGVFLDSEAGSLSFYRVPYNGKLTLLHTFNSSFTEPLFPVIRLWSKVGSVSLVDLRHMVDADKTSVLF